MKASSKLNFVVMTQLLTGLLATHCFGVDYFIGVNFTSGVANDPSTSLDPGDSAGVVPQAGWNNFSTYSVNKGILSDGAGNLTGVTISYLTGEMSRSGTYNVGLGFTNGNDKLFNGYLNSLDPATSSTGTNIITFTNLSPASTYTIIAYTLRDTAGAQAAYWVNEGYGQAIVILTEDESFWQADPTFRRGTDTVRPASQFANYVRWDAVRAPPQRDGLDKCSLRIRCSSELLSRADQWHPGDQHKCMAIQLHPSGNN